MAGLCRMRRQYGAARPVYRRLTMAMKRCPVCGERYSDTYKYCPFCEEEDLEREEEPRRAPARSGRRAGGSRQPNLVTPVLVVLIILMAALLIYLLKGDEIARKLHKDDEADKPGVEDQIPQTPPTVKDPVAKDPVASDPNGADPDAQEPGGNMPDGPDTSEPGDTTPPASPTSSYAAANALPGGLTLTNVASNDFTRGISEGAYRVKVSGGSGSYTWISEDPGIASVDSDGNVTPISAGVTHVLVTDGTRKAVCTVRVTGGGSAPATTPSTGTTQPSTSGGTLKAGAARVVNGGNGVRVRSGPGTNYDILATVPNGGSVQVVQSAGDGWYEITFSNVGGVKTTGYMKGDYLSN